VSFWQWYVRRGRIDRRTWWLHYSLPVAALSVLAVLADVSLGNTDPDAVVAGGSIYGPVVVLVLVLTAPASISASATRLHDRGMPAWWLLLGLVPYLGGLALLVLNGFLPGDAGPNRYGPAHGQLPGRAVLPPFPPQATPPSGPPSPPPSAPPYWG
jgi:uncharacterized membrane protein YhaH (DUF805 family)